jgi:hypothetical protein
MSGPTGDRESTPGATIRVLGWLPFVGCIAAGVIGLIGAVDAHGPSRAEWSTAGGVYLLGAAVAFGLLCNAILRK